MNQFSNATALAQRLSRPLVVFDIEHTGGTKENRAITEFAARVVQLNGELSAYASLVKPRPGTTFEPFVSRLTGIWPSTVQHAPSWQTVMDDFVLPHREAVWVGFNSRSCDTLIVSQECLRLGLELGTLAQIDLVRLGDVSGRLSERVLKLRPDFDTSGAHRADKDALMTLALLDLQLPVITDEDLMNQGVLPRPKKQKPRKKADLSAMELEPTSALQDFLVTVGATRRGQPWLPAESLWVAGCFKSGKTVDELAGAVGRSPISIACALDKFSLLPPDLREFYRLAP